MNAVATATAAVPRLYALNSVPASPAYPYGVYSALLGSGGHYTMDSRHGTRSLRVTVQSFGRSAASALALVEKVTDALLDQSLTIPGYDCAPLRIELDPTLTRDPDDNGIAGVTFTFTAQAAKET